MKVYLKMKSGDIKVEHLNTKSIVPVDVQVSSFRMNVHRNSRPFGDYIVEQWIEG